MPLKDKIFLTVIFFIAICSNFYINRIETTNEYSKGFRDAWRIGLEISEIGVKYGYTKAVEDMLNSELNFLIEYKNEVKNAPRSREDME